MLYTVHLFFCAGYATGRVQCARSIAGESSLRLAVHVDARLHVHVFYARRRKVMTSLAYSRRVWVSELTWRANVNPFQSPPIARLSTMCTTPVFWPVIAFAIRDIRINMLSHRSYRRTSCRSALGESETATDDFTETDLRRSEAAFDAVACYIWIFAYAYDSCTPTPTIDWPQQNLRNIRLVLYGNIKSLGLRSRSSWYDWMVLNTIDCASFMCGVRV